MRLISTKTFSLFAVIAAGLTLAACGNKTSSIHSAETEGIFLNVGQLKYQVQISRQLNPVSIDEDRTFIQGVDPKQATLAPDELWFAVFVRIENDTDKAQAPATSYTIVDTQGNSYTPVKLGKDNPFSFSGAPIPRKSELPSEDSVAAQVGSIGGVELLFKLKRETLDNRPLELHIKSFFPDDEATGTLDV